MENGHRYSLPLLGTRRSASDAKLGTLLPGLQTHFFGNGSFLFWILQRQTVTAIITKVAMYILTLHFHKYEHISFFPYYRTYFLFLHLSKYVWQSLHGDLVAFEYEPRL